MSDVDPRLVLARVALAVPAGVRKRIVIVGSLAAGYQLFEKDRTLTVRTKDIHCALVPRVARNAPRWPHRFHRQDHHEGDDRRDHRVVDQRS